MLCDYQKKNRLSLPKQLEMFSWSRLKRVIQVNKNFVRYKNPPHHWSVVRKRTYIDKALEHFDDFYQQVFAKKWPKIREGLLGKQKYVAVVNNFGDDDETMQKLELSGALNVRRLFQLEKGYLSEELKSKRGRKALGNAWKIDQETEEAPKTNVEEPKAINVKDLSLESSLNSAELDTRRLVDTSNALTSEILYEYIPATKLKGKEDYVTESDHYKMYNTEFSVKVEREYDIHFPEPLKIYCFEMDNFSDFDPPRRCSTGVMNYYLMDGGSILPVLALDLQPGQKILDMCAAPGGKSLLAIQSLCPDCVVANDKTKSRFKRINEVYSDFLYDFKEKWLDTGKVKITNFDGRYFPDRDFDRILVDVPCTTDRHSLNDNWNNLWKPSNTRERLQLPIIQGELLVNALKLVKVGGVVVYSTCSLSPIQNDGVVNMALKQLWEETNIEAVVMDLSPALLQARRVFKFADTNLVKYGHLVLPMLSQNYGPTYFCKLKRIK